MLGIGGFHRKIKEHALMDLVAVFVVGVSLFIVLFASSQTSTKLAVKAAGCNYVVSTSSELTDINNKVLPGETVCINSGRYSVTIRPAVSGTSEEKRIVYKGMGNGSVVVDRRVNLVGKSYVSLIGIDILATGVDKKYLDLSDSDHVTIENSKMTPESDMYPTHPPVKMLNTSYAVLRNVKVMGSNKVYNDTVTLEGKAHHNLIENNRIEQGSHVSLAMEGPDVMYNVIRNNFLINDFHNCFGNIYGPSRNVFEGNYLERCGSGKQAGSSIDGAGASGDWHVWSNENIIRKNVIMQSGRYDPDTIGAIHAVSSTYDVVGAAQGGLVTVVNNRIYNNTIVNNFGDAFNLGIYHRSSYVGNEYRDNRFVNNIMYGNSTTTPLQIEYKHFYDTGSPAPADVRGDEWRSNLIGNPGEGVIKWKSQVWTLSQAAVQSNPKFVNNVAGDPGFVNQSKANPAIADLHLKSGSLAVDGGDFLTTTTSVGSGSVIKVSDARFFSDGYGIVEGDAVRIGSFGQAGDLRVVATDYVNNTLTVNKNISWGSGDKVSLMYSGNKPDIGAYEYESVVNTIPTSTPTPAVTVVPSPTGVVPSPTPVIGGSGVNSSLSFTGSASYVKVLDPANGSLDMGTGDFTVEAWIKTSSGSNQTIVYKGGGAVTEPGYWFWHTNANLKLYVSNGSSRIYGTSIPVALVDGNWHHVAVSVNRSGNMDFYVDGNSAGSSSVTGMTGSSLSTSSGLEICGNTNNYPCVGSMDEVRIWKTARTATQIKQTMSNEIDPASTGLVGYWKFNENSGTVVKDATSNASNGTVYGGSWGSGPTLVKGINSALSFTGSASYVKVLDPANGSLDMGTGDFTVEAWIKTSSGSNQTIVYKGGGAVTEPGYWFWHSVSNLKLYVSNGTTRVYATSNVVTLADGNWHHVAASASRTGSVNFYLDGNLVGTGSISQLSGLSLSTSSGLEICGNTNNYPCVGSMDEVRIWKTARTATQIKQTMSNEIDPASTGLVGYWKFNENSGTVVKDATSNASNGTVYGGSWANGFN